MKYAVYATIGCVLLTVFGCYAMDDKKYTFSGSSDVEQVVEQTEKELGALSRDVATLRNEWSALKPLEDAHKRILQFKIMYKKLEAYDAMLQEIEIRRHKTLGNRYTITQELMSCGRNIREIRADIDTFQAYYNLKTKRFYEKKNIPE